MILKWNVISNNEGVTYFKIFVKVTINKLRLLKCEMTIVSAALPPAIDST